MFFKKTTRWVRLFDSAAAAENLLSEGQVISMDAGRRKICLARTAEGFFAVDDRCPHNGASLGNGYCTKEGSVVCPLHRYHFDLRSGRAKSGLGDAVRTYPLESREDGLYIGFETTGWSFF